jgi:hypothetical protein
LCQNINNKEFVNYGAGSRAVAVAAAAAVMVVEVVVVMIIIIIIIIVIIILQYLTTSFGATSKARYMKYVLPILMT